MSHTGAAAPAWHSRASEKNCWKLGGNCSGTELCKEQQAWQLAVLIFLLFLVWVYF